MMPVETVKIFPYNILETGAVSVTGPADTGFPKARLWDRSINLLWKLTTGEGGDSFGHDDDSFGYDGDLFGHGPETAQQIVFLINQSTSIKPVDILFVTGHNFDTFTVRWQYSNDGTTWIDAVTAFMQSGNGDIIKAISSIARQYWRLVVESAVNPQAAEIIMSEGLSFNIAETPNPTHGWEDNIIASRSIGGQLNIIKLGVEKRIREYKVKADATVLTSLSSLYGDLSGFSKPFLIKDKDGFYFMVIFTAPPTNNYFIQTITEVNLSFMEVL